MITMNTEQTKLVNEALRIHGIDNTDRVITIINQMFQNANKKNLEVFNMVFEDMASEDLGFHIENFICKHGDDLSPENFIDKFVEDYASPDEDENENQDIENQPDRSLTESIIA